MPPSQREKFGKAVEAEARTRFYNWLKGVERYAAAPMLPRPKLSGKAIYHCGATTLYRYGRSSGGGAPVLVIPSLINRSYILDMPKNQSFMKHLGRTIDGAYLLDWGEPEAEEKPLCLSAYITERLLPAMLHLYATHGQPVSLVGYCMGGLFAMAASQLAPEKVGKLALLATPWDFHSQNNQQGKKGKPSLFWQAVDWRGILPHALIHHWFYLQKPWSVHDKFARFAQLPEQSAAEQNFVALEHWLQDGVGMSGPAAYTCFVEWAEQNQPLAGRWQVGGVRITPKAIEKPVFLGIPERDGVVPPAATAPLTHAWPHAHIHRMEAGHVSMIAGLNARKTLWNPLVRWLENEVAGF